MDADFEKRKLDDYEGEPGSAVGGAIAYKQMGSGTPLLLINGYAASTDAWDPTFMAALAEQAGVTCPDNRGIGGSAPLTAAAAPLSIDSMAADGLALLNR